MSNYTQLNTSLIIEQMRVLSKRIEERFPNSGLYAISKEAYALTQKVKDKQIEFSKPNYVIKGLSYFLIALIIIGVFYTIHKIELPGGELKLFELFQVFESGINDIVFIVISIFFLSNIEERFTRKKALQSLDELRALIHIIDMHQLSKDPQLLIHRGTETESSPKRTYSRFQMGRYFNYCSELLALWAKVSALYIQDINDQIILSAANEIENLSANISQKIWQKIMILSTEEHETNV